jgi:hypothetical protein
MASKRTGKGSKNKAASSDRIENLVAQAIDGIESRLTAGKDTLGIGDYIKVMQLQKEIEEEQPQEITVTWIDPEKQKEK